MRRILAMLLLLPLFSGSIISSATGAEIISMTPNTGEVGTSVTLRGGPFTPQSRIIFGSKTLTPSNVTPKQITFSVPEVAAGDYRITVEEEQRVSESSFFFRVTTPEPWVSEISPSEIDACTSPDERRLTIEGRDFHADAQVLVDEAATTPRQVESERIILQLPELNGGRHLIQVVNPDGNESLPQALQVNNIPEILSVSTGEDNVNAYQVVLSGKNFHYDSRLRVNDKHVEKSSEQRPGADFIEFVDCNTLIYTRHPVSRGLRRVSLQVINPGGEHSPVFHVTMP